MSNEETTPAISRRVLVIDHDDQIRKVLCAELTALGFMVEEEPTGIAGLSRLSSDAETHPFHGLLVELQLPILGGLAVLLEMGERFPTVPVIAMSDVQHLGKLRQAVKLGAKEYLLKPFDTELCRRKCLRVFRDGHEP